MIKMSDENIELKKSLDEIVFQNRNKEYGAFDLRGISNRILLKSFVIGVGLFVSVVGIAFIANLKNNKDKKKTEVKAQLVDIKINDEIIEKPKEETPPPPPPPAKKEEKKEVEMVKNLPPEPKRDVKIETPPPPPIKVGTNVGTEDHKGEKVTTYTPPPSPSGNVGGTGKAPLTTPDTGNTIHTSVDVEASYPGGVNSFRSDFQQSFDSDAMDGEEGTIKCEVTFIVEKDGSITQVKATGSNSAFNREAERTAKSIRKRWTPAKIGGQPVRSRFRLPVVMNFE